MLFLSWSNFCRFRCVISTLTKMSNFYGSFVKLLWKFFTLISYTVTLQFLQNLVKRLLPRRQWIHILGAIWQTGLIQKNRFEFLIIFGWHFSVGGVCTLWVLLLWFIFLFQCVLLYRLTVNQLTVFIFVFFDKHRLFTNDVSDSVQFRFTLTLRNL